MRVRFYAFLLILAFSGLLLAKTSVISHAPQTVTVLPANDGAEISWTFHLPDTVFSYNDSYPWGVWDPHMKQALGVILDLSAYPSATLEQIDFAHWGREKIHGPYYYNILFFDMDSSKLFHRIDSVEAHDAYDIPRFEVGVPLGSVPARDHVGIFVEGLSTFDGTHAFPALMSDTSAYVPGVSYELFDVDDPWYEKDPKYTNFFELGDVAQGATNLILDVWVNLNGNKILVSGNHSPFHLGENPVKPDDIYLGGAPKSVSDQVISPDIIDGFYIYRQAPGEDSLSIFGQTTTDARTFTDNSTLAENDYIYAVGAYNAISVSRLLSFDYHQPPILNIAEAKTDANDDFIPDRLNQELAIRGTIISPDFNPNCQYFISDGTAGIQVFSFDFNIQLSIGDSVFVSGQLTQFKGLTELEVDTVARFQNLGNHSIDTLQVTLPDIGENLEGRLIVVDNLKIANPNEWPVEGQNGTKVTVSDGQNSIKLYIDKDTDLDGWTPPAGTFRLVAIVDQYTSSSPANDGYELRPRSQTDFIPTTAIDNNRIAAPARFNLKPCYPNPFNPQTTIEYQIAKTEHVLLQVFDSQGKLVKELTNSMQKAGTYKIHFTAANLSSGIYLVRLQAGTFVQTQKIVLLK